MSHLARELDRQLVWIEKRTKDLTSAVEDLVRAGSALTSGTDGWDEAQAEAIREAIVFHADECGQYISQAQAEVDAFRERIAGSGQ